MVIVYRDFSIHVVAADFVILYRQGCTQTSCVGVFGSVRGAVSSMVRAVILERASGPKQAAKLLGGIRKTLTRSLSANGV